MMLATTLFLVSSCLLILSSVDIATAQINGDLRLVRRFFTSSSYTSGRLEIYWNGRWGTVCDDGWDLANSNVACRQLGYSGTIRPYYRTSSTVTGFGSGSGSIWLDDVNCRGTESRLLSCSRRAIGSHNCAHFEDVAIYCSSFRITTPTSSSVGAVPGNLRLVRGRVTDPSYSSGRVEIFLNGQWGTVCDDFWGQDEADVTCRQLGYSRATSYGQADQNGFSAGTGPIWLDDISCSPSSSTLLSCTHNGIGGHNCVHGEDIAVFCSSGLSSGLSVGAIVGIAIGIVFGALCLIITCCVICCVCCAKHYSKRRTQRSFPTNTTVTSAAPYPAATLVTATTSSQAKSGTAYPTYPHQPAQTMAYPVKGQEFPPPYAGHEFEMQPTFQSYPPQPQAGYPPWPAGYADQTATLAHEQAYPAEAAPYPTDVNQGYPPQQ